MTEALRKEIKAYLEYKKILILDPSRVLQKSLKENFLLLGASSKNIFTAECFQLGNQLLEKKQPHVILAPYRFVDGYGLDLIKKQRVLIPSPFERVFLLTSIFSKQNVVAEAAEEEVDGFFLKPIQMGSIFKDFLGLFQKKVCVSEKQKQYLKAKEDFLRMRYQEAKEQFLLLKKEKYKVALACYYLGRIYIQENELSFAYDQFQEGFLINKKHYKCLVGLFEVLDKMGKYQEAYQVVQKILKTYPISPQRLARMFELAVYTHHFKEIDSFYDSYSRLVRKPQNLKKRVIAALIVSGKYLLQNRQLEKAQENMRKAWRVSGRQWIYFQTIVRAFLKEKYVLEAKKWLDSIPQKEKNKVAFKILSFLVHATEKMNETLFKEGVQLVEEGGADSDVFLLLLRYCGYEGKKETGMELFKKAQGLFPEKKEEFLEFAQMIQAS